MPPVSSLPEEPFLVAAARRQEAAEAFFVLLERLPSAQRSVLLLHVIENFSLEEIASITSVPVGTVKSRLHHAKRVLRNLVEEPA